MEVYEEIKNAIENKKAYGIKSLDSSTKSINNDGEFVVWSNTVSLPALLENLVKKKRLEIRDYQILINSKKSGIRVKIWVCPKRK